MPNAFDAAAITRWIPSPPNAFGGDTDDDLEIDEDELDIVADTVLPLKSGGGGVGGVGAVGEAPCEDEDSDVDGDLLLGSCCPVQSEQLNRRLPPTTMLMFPASSGAEATGHFRI